MKNSLYEMLKKTKRVEELKKEVKYIEDVLNSASTDIENYEKDGNKFMEDVCASLYNEYNLRRLKTLLQINILEREIINFEIDVALKD